MGATRCVRVDCVGCFPSKADTLTQGEAGDLLMWEIWALMGHGLIWEVEATEAFQAERERSLTSAVPKQCSPGASGTKVGQASCRPAVLAAVLLCTVAVICGLQGPCDSSHL